MADTNISGIAKVVLQARADMKAANPGKDKEGVDFSASFMDMMKNQENFQTSVSSSKASTESIAPVSSKDNANGYDSYTAKPNNVSVKEEITPEKIQEEGAEELEEFTENVFETLEEEYHVSKEDIEVVLASLGFTVTDLMEPKNLMAFVTELTGEDVGMLFLSESFQNVMQEISVLTEELAQSLGITKEQLVAFTQALKEDMPKAELNQGGTEISQEVLTVPNEENQPVDEKNVQTNMAVQNAAGEKPVANEVQPVEEAEETEESQPVFHTPETEGEEEQETFQDGRNENSFEQGKSSKTQQDTSHVQGTNIQNNKVEEFAVPKDPVITPYTSQVNVADIIEQIANHVKISFSLEGTTMEMQLNPENLGKIYLNISEKEGVIRAQLAAQNEVVKEALETQMVELRQNLNQQGIKVDAIEVTVATHEFEQNLDGQAKQEEQAGEQMEQNQKKARRSLNLNDLDGLSGLMSEEEELVTKIMRDNGNQVDLTV